MDISEFEPKEQSPLHYFLKFVESLERQNEGLATYVNINREDWDNMCGISLVSTLGDRKQDNICFNFYNDGNLRAIINREKSDAKT